MKNFCARGARRRHRSAEEHGMRTWQGRLVGSLSSLWPNPIPPPAVPPRGPPTLHASYPTGDSAENKQKSATSDDPSWPPVAHPAGCMSLPAAVVGFHSGPCAMPNTLRHPSPFSASLHGGSNDHTVPLQLQVQPSHGPQPPPRQSCSYSRSRPRFFPFLRIYGPPNLRTMH
jgi:hypothetical protein